MRHSLKTALIVFSLLLLALPPCNDVRSCYFGPEWDDTRALFFEPGLESGNGFAPFFYTPHLFNLRYDYDSWTGMDDSTLIHADYWRNCREWRENLGGNMPLEDIYKVIYGSEPDQFLNAFEMDSLRTAFPGNAFVQKLLSPQNRSFLKYLAFSKRLEFQQFAPSDPWNFNEATQTDAALDSLTNQARRGLQSDNNAFLKTRWAYQLLTCQFYKADSSFLQTFSTHFSLQDKTVLMPWALTKVAEAQSVAQSNYSLSKVFELCQSKRTLAILRFISKEAESALPYCKNDLERAGVIAMRAFQNPGRGLNDLKKISAYSLESPYIPVLISREINKLEDWVLTKSLTGYYNQDHPEFDYDSNFDKKVSAWTLQNIEKDKAYLAEFNAWVQSLDRPESPASLRDFVRLAAAHLCWIQKDAAAAQSWIDKVGTKAAFQLQKKQEQVLLLPLQQDINQPEAQQDLVQLLTEIRKRVKELSFPDKRLGRIYLYLAHAFYQKQNIPVAALLFNRSLLTTGTERHYGSSFYESIQFFDNLATVNDLENTLTLLAKPRKSAFENFITSPYSEEEKLGNIWYFNEDEDKFLPVPSRATLLDVQGTIAFREGDYVKANQCFKQIPASHWQEASEYNYYLNQDFFGSVDSLPQHQLKPDSLGKAAFIQKLLNLESEIQAHPAKKAEALYLLGNGHFEASYWGRGWLLFCYGKGWSYNDDPGGRSPANLSYNFESGRYDNIYKRCSRAIECYERCLKSNPTPELAAKASYMLSYCQFMASGAGDESPSRKFFRIWKKQYSSSKTYREILKECPTLRDYLRK